LFLEGFFELATNIIVAFELTALSPNTFCIIKGLEVGNSPYDIQL
jgi:hypothetical protein